MVRGVALQGKGRELVGVFWNVPRPLPPPKVFFWSHCLLSFVYCVVLCFALVGLMGRYGMVVGDGIGYNIVSWGIFSMVCGCFGVCSLCGAGLLILIGFWQEVE